MFFKLLTISGIWIAFGFAAGCAIWAGMVIARNRTMHGDRGDASNPESASDPASGRGDGGVTYRVIKGGLEDTDTGNGDPARPEENGRELLNFPR